jgi:NAD(P)H-hydrate epimerase
MKVFTSEQIRRWDEYSIANEPISSYQLMQRAALAFSTFFEKKFLLKNKKIHIFCGSGNNGGDGLCIANLLSKKHENVFVYLFESHSKSADNQQAMQDLQVNAATVFTINESVDWQGEINQIDKNDLVIDAILGSGLNRPIEGFLENLIFAINQKNATTVSVDVPSGLFCDEKTSHQTINADYTFTFQSPKLAFFFPENQDKVGEWSVLNIGLHQDFFRDEKTENYYITSEIIKQIYTPRKKFDHKGTFGASLILAGSYGKMGAAVLATRACLRTGAGLLTTYIPKIGYDIMQISVPEAMVLTDQNVWNIADVPNLKPYRAIGAGMGIGTSKETVLAFEKLIDFYKQPMVLDADALNILSFRQDLLVNLPKNTILTPHVKEFERMFGECQNDWERSEKASAKAVELGVIIVLKGAHSCIAAPDGKRYFNTTGNPGMATGGSGDVLAGMLTSLIAQGYPPLEATIFGVYLHGLAGDLVAKSKSQEAMSAGDIVDFLGKAYKKIGKI